MRVSMDKTEDSSLEKWTKMSKELTAYHWVPHIHRISDFFACVNAWTRKKLQDCVKSKNELNCVGEIVNLPFCSPWICACVNVWKRNQGHFCVNMWKWKIYWCCAHWWAPLLTAKICSKIIQIITSDNRQLTDYQMLLAEVWHFGPPKGKVL